MLEDLTTYLPSLLNGLKLTVLITLVAMALALVLGLLLAVGQLNRERWYLWLPCRALVEFIRGTPLLLQIFYAYFVLPRLGIALEPLQAGTLALALNFGCYISEVYRAGIEAVPKGQLEAGRTLGLSELRILQRIVIPQAVRVVVPPLGNYLLTLFKDTALLSTISIVELMFATNLVAATNFRYVEMYTVALVVYFVISFPSSLALRALERRLKAPPLGPRKAAALSRPDLTAVGRR